MTRKDAINKTLGTAGCISPAFLLVILAFAIPTPAWAAPIRPMQTGIWPQAAAMRRAVLSQKKASENLARQRVKELQPEMAGLRARIWAVKTGVAGSTETQTELKGLLNSNQ